MIVQPSLLGHVKFLRLKKFVGDCAAEVLLRLWSHCQQATHGQRLGDASPDDVELLCAWAGTPGLLYEALVRSKWLDVKENGRIEVHAWDEHNAQLRAAWKNGEVKRRAAAAKRKETERTGSDAPSDASSNTKPTGGVLIYSNLLSSSSEEGVQGEESNEPSKPEFQGQPPAEIPEFVIPTEDEVVAFAADWSGDMARAIPPGIPEVWTLGWLNYRLRDPSRFPADWQGDLVRSFVRDWVKGLPDARGVSPARGVRTPFALKTQLDALEIRIKEHPGNPDSNSCSGDPTDQETEDFRALKRARGEIIRKLSEGK